MQSQKEVFDNSSNTSSTEVHASGLASSSYILSMLHALPVTMYAGSVYSLLYFLSRANTKILVTPVIFTYRPRFPIGT